MAQPSYISRSEINEKLAADREYLAEMLQERKDLEARAAPIIERLEELDRQIASTSKSVAEWSDRRPG